MLPRPKTKVALPAPAVALPVPAVSLHRPIVVPPIPAPRAAPPPPIPAPPPPPPAQYFFGVTVANPYLGTKFTEVLNAEKVRCGWIWTHSTGRIVVMPTLGFHIWHNAVGNEWTTPEGALFLTRNRH